MRGYRFLISASYPYPLKTIRIRILSVQTLLTAIRILSISIARITMEDGGCHSHCILFGINYHLKLKIAVSPYF